MRSIHLAGLTILVLLAGCGCESKPREPVRPETPPATASAESGPSNTASAPLPPAKVTVPKLRAIPWTPQADREQHLRYHWPADFKLPIEFHFQPPKVPREIQGPSPPIKPAS